MRPATLATVAALLVGVFCRQIHTPSQQLLPGGHFQALVKLFPLRIQRKKSKERVSEKRPKVIKHSVKITNMTIEHEAIFPSCMFA